MINIEMKLESMNVPDNLPHKSRAREIEELPNFLRVKMIGAVNALSLVYKSTIAPPPDYEDCIWWRQDPVGNSIGLYSLVNGTWVPFGSIAGTGTIPGGSTTGTTNAVTSILLSPNVVQLVALSTPVLVTATGGVPPYVASATVTSQPYVNIQQSGLNKEQIYLSGLQTGFGNIQVTDSVNSMIAIANFSVSPATSGNLSVDKTILYFPPNQTAQTVTITGGTAPYFGNVELRWIGAPGQPGYIWFTISITTDTLTVTPTKWASNNDVYATITITDSSGIVSNKAAINCYLTLA